MLDAFHLASGPGDILKTNDFVLGEDLNVMFSFI